MRSPDEESPKQASTPEEARTRSESIRRVLTPAKSWFRTSPRGQRIAPRMRFAQVGVAVAAIGVLGITFGNTGTEENSRASEQQRTAVENRSVRVPQPNAEPKAQAKVPQPKLEEPGAEPSAPGSAQSRGGQSSETESAEGEDAEAGEASEESGGEEESGDSIDRWIEEASTTLERHGYPEHQIDEEAIRTIIMNESGGDPNVVNNWDSNAAAGTPSQGLMQTITPTFDSYALPGHDEILDPVDNIIAGTRYSIEKYGSVSEVPGISGLRSGGSYQGY